MNNRIIGFIGAALLIIGVFMPLISFLGIISFSLFTFIQSSLPGQDPTGMVTLFRFVAIGILLLGIGSLALTWKNNFRPLVATGVAALACLVFIFIKLQSLFSSVPSEARDMGGVSIGMGLYIMVLGSIALIVAGVMKSTAPIHPGYGPPPPPPYTPGY